MENFINTLKTDWYYTQKAIEMVQGKWFWYVAILIVIGCAVYVAVKRPLMLPLIAWGPLSSVVINNAIYLKLLKHMDDLEYTQCTAFALIVGMIVGAIFVAMAAHLKKESYRTGLKGLFCMPPIEVFTLFALVFVLGMGDAFARNPLQTILAFGILFGIGAGASTLVVIIL